MIELLWLLLPVAAASGWLTAWLTYRQGPTNSSWSPDYLKGLNYLLNEEPDKALDVFIKLIEVDNDTVETHLSLGVLFRRRGEVNRAIRIHQNLIARPTLLPQQRNLALFELAQDYHHAGLLDRAEELFQELVASQTHQVLALRQLLDIYQQEHDWVKAIRTAKQLASANHKSMHTEIAQYYCEQAEVHLKQKQDDAARQAIQYALKTDSSCVRASLLEGQLALSQGNLKQAILAFKRVEQQEPDYLIETLEPLQTCYQALGKPSEFINYLHKVLQTHGGIRPMLMLATLIKQQDSEQQAADFIALQLHKQLSLRGFDYLLDLALSKTAAILTIDHLLSLKTLTRQLLKNEPAYKCDHCGFMARNLHWQCPSCKQWNTLKPRQEE